MAMSEETGRRAGSKNIREPRLDATGAFGQDTPELYEFGPFRLEPAERKLLRNGEPIVLTPKAFDTLVLLVRNSGHLLGKEELIRTLWPDSFVEEGNLSNNIFVLRKALGEDPHYIETVPKRGYRFVGADGEIARGGAGGCSASCEGTSAVAELGCAHGRCLDRGVCVRGLVLQESGGQSAEDRFSSGFAVRECQRQS